MEIYQMNRIINDSELNWLVRTCMNAFNVYLTMIHLIIYDSIVGMHLDNDPQFLDTMCYPAFLAGMDVMLYLSLW